jgi:fibronectin-binding autotransporter adhesin
MKYSLLALITTATLCLLADSSSFAATDTWNGGPGSWASGANWSSNPTAPGAVGTTTNADIAFFTSGSGTVTVDANRNVKSITFDTGAGAYTLGGGPLALSTGGTIALGTTGTSFTGTGITETISAPILLENNAFSIYNFTNLSTNASDVLNISGPISNGTVNSGVTLALIGANTGANTVSGSIGNGGNLVNLTTAGGTGNWILSAANTFGGTTAVSGGTLQLNNANAVQDSIVTISLANGLKFGTGIGTFNLAALAGASNEALTDIGGTNGVTLQLGLYNNAAGSYSGILSGPGGITKFGTGTQTLSGNNTYTGTTTVTGLPTDTIASTLATTTGTPFGVGNVVMNGGNLSITGTGVAALTGVSNAAGSTFTYAGGDTLFLKKGTGLSYTIGNASPSGSVLVRSGNGVLIVQTNSNDLGTAAATGEDFFVTGTAPATNATNKMVSASIVTLGGGTASSGDFLTYGANGFASDSTNYVATGGVAVGSALPTTQIENVNASTSFTTNNQAYALLVQNTFTATINSGVTLTIAGDGTTDGVILNGGKIVGASATSALNFGATEGIIYDFNAAATLSVPITGSGGVTFAGNKAFSFGNPTGATSNGSTYTGGANLEGVSFSLKTSNDTTGTNDDLTIFGAPTNTITLNGATLTGNLAEEAGRTVVLGPSGASISASGSLAFNISGSGALTLTGGSSISYMALDGNSSYSGGTYLNGAMAIIASENNIGGASAPITFFANNSGLSIVGTSLTSLSNPLSFVANAGGAVAFDIQSPDNAATGNYSFTLGQALNFGTTGFQKYGLGTLVLTGAETYSGTTFLSGGVLEVNEAAGGSLSSATPLSFNGGTLYILGAASGTTTQTVGNVTLGQKVAGAPTNGGAIVVDSNLSNGGAGTTLNLGTLPGGSGTDTTVPGGALQLKVNDSSASITTTTAPDGTGIYGGRIVFTDASGNTNWATSSSSGPTYTISGYSSYTTYNGTTDGQVNTGNGRLTGSLTSAGPTTFNTLKIANTSTGTGYDLAGQTLTLTAGGLLFTGTADYTISSSVAGGTIVSGLTTGTTNTYNLTSAYTGPTSDLVVQDYGTARLTISAVITNGAVSEFSNLTKAGPGTLVLTGANTYTGATFVNGGILQISSDSNIGGNNGTINVTNSLTTSPTVTLASSTLPAGFGVGSNFLGRVVVSISGTTVTLTGNANTAIASSSAVSWATEQYLVLNGGTLQVTSNVTLSESNSAGLAPTGTLGRPFELGSAGGTINMLNGSTLTMVSGSAISTFTGAFQGLGPAALTIDANDGLGGTVVLGGSADEAIGGIIINGGTLQTSVTASLNPLALNTITFGSGTENSIATHPTLALAAGTSNFIAGLDSPSGSSALVKNVSGAAILNIVNAGTDTYTGLLNNGATGSLAITKGGAGIQNLTNTGNTYTGATRIDDGTLNVASLANGGSNSSIGASTNAAANLVFGGGPVGSAVLQYTGSTAISTDRLFTLGDANPDAFVMGNNGAIDASGSNSGATMSFTSSGSIAFANPVFTHNLTLTGTNTGANTFAPILGDSTLPTSLSKTGTGTWVLAGANTYTGATTVSAGTLALGTGGSLAGTAVAVNSTGTLQINGNRSIGTSGVASVAVNSGGTLSLVDGAIYTLTLNTTSGNSLVMGGGGTLAFDLGATSDQILLSSGTASVTGNTTVNITSLGSLSGTTQTLISAAGGGLGTTGFTLGTITGSTGIYTLSLNETNNNLFLNETGSGAVTAAFWSGANGSAWNTTSPTTNFNTDPGSDTPTSAVPSSVTNVTFTATGAINSAATTLGQDFTINSLTFNTTGVGIGGSNTLTILGGNANGNTLGNGITSTGSGTNTISSAVALGSSQTWTANSGNTLTVSGLVSDGGKAYSLTTAGSGQVSLTHSSGNTYTGGTTVSAGTLLVSNGSGSATGTGAVAVSAGATLSGNGIIAPTGTNGISLASGGNLTPGGVQTSVPFTGTPGTTANGSLTLNTAGTTAGSTILNITSANLTFALGAGNATSGSQIIVTGGVANTIAFSGSSTAIINDLVGAQLTLNQEYVVIDGDDTTYTGLTFGGTNSLGTLITGGLNLVAPNTAGNFYSQWYNTSQLYLNGDNIEVEVVPEPSTWALMLGGLSVLVFYQRRKRGARSV